MHKLDEGQLAQYPSPSYSPDAAMSMAARGLLFCAPFHRVRAAARSRSTGIPFLHHRHAPRRRPEGGGAGAFGCMDGSGYDGIGRGIVTFAVLVRAWLA
jgi:hypothetical protein